MIFRGVLRNDFRLPLQGEDWDTEEGGLWLTGFYDCRNPISDHQGESQGSLRSDAAAQQKSQESARTNSRSDLRLDEDEPMDNHVHGVTYFE